MSESGGDVVMLSALQHYLFCPRQCALIHVEGVWNENFLTASGRQLHERSDSGMRETRSNVHRATSLRLSSQRYGIAGVADVVEFFAVEVPLDEKGNVVGVALSGRRGFWRPFPVEYKRGKPKLHRADEVQLCGQALCLEEMLGVRIEKGALFYGETRRRTDVVFDETLRTLTTDTVRAVRKMLDEGVTPGPVVTKGCEACSLVGFCQPEICGHKESAERWVLDRVDEAL